MARQLYSPMAQMNGVLCTMRGLDFGLVTGDYTIAASGHKDLVVQTPVPMKVRACLALTSGSVTIDIDKNATGIFAAGDAVQATASDTNEHNTVIDTDASNLFAVVRITNTSGVTAAVINQLYVQVSGMLPEGYDWHSVRYAHNALVLQVNSGVFLAGPTN